MHLFFLKIIVNLSTLFIWSILIIVAIIKAFIKGFRKRLLKKEKGVKKMLLKLDQEDIDVLLKMITEYKESNKVIDNNSDNPDYRSLLCELFDYFVDYGFDKVIDHLGNIPADTVILLYTKYHDYWKQYDLSARNSLVVRDSVYMLLNYYCLEVLNYKIGADNDKY